MSHSLTRKEKAFLNQNRARPGEVRRKTDFRPLVLDFLKSPELDQQEAAIRGLEQQRTAASLCIAGSAWADVARFRSSGRRRTFLERGFKNWKRAARMQPFTQWSGKAATNLAFAGHYFDLVVEGKHPEPQTAERVFSRLVDISAQYKKALAVNMPKRQCDELSGESAELSVLLLFSREAVRSGSTSGFVLPSFFSEDAFGTPEDRGGWGEGVRRSWDISYYSQYDDSTPPDLTYKVQVKSNPSDMEYADDISVVHLNPDLQLPEQAGIRLPTTLIGYECFLEQQGNTKATDALNRRTELLFDILDK